MHIHLTESITQLLEHADIQPDTFVAIIIIARKFSLHVVYSYTMNYTDLV